MIDATHANIYPTPLIDHEGQGYIIRTLCPWGQAQGKVSCAVW